MRDRITDPDSRQAVIEIYKMYLSRSGPWPPELIATYEGFNTELHGYMWGLIELTTAGTLQKYDREPDLPKLDAPDTHAESIRHFLDNVDGPRQRYRHCPRLAGIRGSGVLR